MLRGRSVLILAIWSLTSFSALSMSTEPTLNWTMVTEEPSVTVEMMCQTPFRLETASSIFLVTWLSSSDGAAPDWVICTCTIGMSMFGKRVIDIVRKLTRPSTVKTTKPTIAGIGLRMDQAETLRRMAGPQLPVAASAIGRTRSWGRKKAAARATTLSPSARPSRISTASPSTMPGVTLRSSMTLSLTTIRCALSPSTLSGRGRNRDAVALDEIDFAGGEGADARAARVDERDANLAGAAALVDFLIDETHLRGEVAAEAGEFQFCGHADLKPRQILLGDLGLEIYRAILDDAEQRLTGGRNGPADLGGAPTDDAGDGRDHVGARQLDLQFAPLGFARPAVGFRDGQRMIGGLELGLGRLQRGFALLDLRSRHDGRAELAGALEIVGGPVHLRLRLVDQRFRLLDRGVGARDRGVVLRELRLELGLVEAGEHLAGLHDIAVLGVELDDRHAVHARRDVGFLARDKGAGDEQPVDERATLRRGHRDGRRLDFARRLRRRRLIGAGRRITVDHLVESADRRRTGREFLSGGGADHRQCDERAQKSHA